VYKTLEDTGILAEDLKGFYLVRNVVVYLELQIWRGDNVPGGILDCFKSKGRQLVTGSKEM